MGGDGGGGGFIQPYISVRLYTCVFALHMSRTSILVFTFVFVCMYVDAHFIYEVSMSKRAHHAQFHNGIQTLTPSLNQQTRALTSVPRLIDGLSPCLNTSHIWMNGHMPSQPPLNLLIIWVERSTSTRREYHIYIHVCIYIYI